MQQVTVPQFLDVEDKIFGPVTIRQFIELMVGGMFVFIFYKTFDFSLFVTASILVIGLTLIVAFVRVNGQAFHLFLLNLISTLKNPKLKVWKKKLTMEELKMEMKTPVETRPMVRTVPRKSVTVSKLSELSLIVDTGGAYTGEE